MVTRVVQPSSERPMIEQGGAPSVQVNTWMRQITDQALIIGTGNPEGIVEASQGAQYMDESGTAGNILYIKRDADNGANDRRFGWILV